LADALFRNYWNLRLVGGPKDAVDGCVVKKSAAKASNTPNFMPEGKMQGEDDRNEKSPALGFLKSGSEKMAPESMALRNCCRLELL